MFIRFELQYLFSVVRFAAADYPTPNIPTTPSGKKQKIPKALRDPNAKKQSKEPKIPKEKKPKKENSPKKVRTPKIPKNKAWSGREESDDAAAVAAAAAAMGGPGRAPYMFPNLLDQFSGGHGFNPLFQSVGFGLPQTGPSNPFPSLAGLDMMNFPSQMKRNQPFGDMMPIPNFDPTLPTDPTMINSIKPQCNVAPLVPKLPAFDMGHQQQMSPHSFSQQQQVCFIVDR